MVAPAFRPAITLAASAVLIAAGLVGGSAASADSPPTWMPTSTTTVDGGDVTVTWETAQTTTPTFLANDGSTVTTPEPMYRPNVVNDSNTVRYFGFGTDFRTQGVVDPLWTPAPWETFITNLNLDAIREGFWFELQPGQSYADDGAPGGNPGPWYEGMPSWSGHTITIFELDGPASDADGNPITPSPAATPLASVTTSGGFVAADLSNVDEDNLSAIMGRQLTVSGGSTDSNGDPQLFPGLTASVTASGLTPGLAVDLWVIRDMNYAYFQFLGGGLPTSAIKVGTGTVAADGTLAAYFVLPDSIPYATQGTAYQMVAGVTADRYWPAGTWDHFVVKAPPAGTSTTIETTGTTTETASMGATQMSLTFSDPGASGSTTATATSTGPTPTGFRFATNPPLYYQLSTTVTNGGTATVCISYDQTVLTTPPELYHFDTSTLTWVDITTSAGPGQVCGQTTSFSPFTLGYPTYSFGGFQPPVSTRTTNVAKAGQAIPVSFSLGGDRGLGVVVSAQFQPQGTDGSPSGNPVPTTTAGKSGLQYNTGTGVYTYVWKTSSAWAGQIGTFLLTLSDGSVHSFTVAFKK